MMRQIVFAGTRLLANQESSGVDLALLDRFVDIEDDVDFGNGCDIGMASECSELDISSLSWFFEA